MKGLLKNNFMGVLENIKILIPLVLLFGILVSATGSASLLGIFSLILTPALLVLVVLCLRKESLSKWYKYKISLPVKRNQIVQSYYISHVCWCVAGMIVVTIFMTITILIHGNQYFYYGFRDAFTLVLGGGILAILVGISVLINIFLGNKDVSDTTYYISLIMILSITCVAFIGSYFLSAFIFQKKEYS